MSSTGVGVAPRYLTHCSVGYWGFTFLPTARNITIFLFPRRRHMIPDLIDLILFFFFPSV